jgi:prepilin-type N-terminal cleavage/methylation domain-containing protein
MLKYFRKPAFERRQQDGFTLVEMLIVIVVLGILAMIIVPQVAVSTDDARLKTLQTNLGTLRSAVEVYYAQHNQVYPGEHDNLGAAGALAGPSALAFVEQLTQYTDIDGHVAAVKDNTYKYGPYVKGADLPTNPFDDGNDVVCDVGEDDITVKASDGLSSWKFYPQTGVLLANDGQSTDGVDHEDL